MSPPSFRYAAEKFAVARHALMIPHLQGEARSIVDAFHECTLGLEDIDLNDLDDDARNWVAQLQELMDTTGIDDPDERGTWLIKADQLTDTQKFDLSNAVDGLAHWFRRQ